MGTDLLTTLIELVPDVCQFHAEQDAIHSIRLVQYMRMLAAGSFPISNISYQVFLDLVNWYFLPDKKIMRYSPQVKQFWHICKILFHNQCLEFFRGMMNRYLSMMNSETLQMLKNSLIFTLLYYCTYMYTSIDYDELLYLDISSIQLTSKQSTFLQS